MNRATSATLVLCLVAACSSQSPPPDAGGPEGSIAISRNGAILLVDVATGEEHVLVAKNTYDRPLAWLPSGEHLLYWNHDGGAWDIWAIDPVSTRAANLTRSANDSRSAEGSPDGRTIAFQRGGQGVWLMDADGGNQRRVHERGHRDAPPCWSPSGRRLAFTDLEHSPDGRIALVVHLVELSDGAANATRPLGRGSVACFLDEETLLVSATHEGAPELVAIEVASGQRYAVTRSPADDHSAVLSPDGTRIAWIEETVRDARLRIMNKDGSGVRDLCEIDAHSAPPSFSPDGRYLAFQSGARPDGCKVHIVPAAGGDVRLLTPAGGSYPVWRPRRRVAERE